MKGGNGGRERGRRKGGGGGGVGRGWKRERERRKSNPLKVRATPTLVAKKHIQCTYADLEGRSVIETLKWTPGGRKVTNCCGSVHTPAVLENNTCTKLRNQRHLVDQSAAVYAHGCSTRQQPTLLSALEK